MDDNQKSQQQAEEQIEDLDVEKSEAEEVKGGVRKAGGKQEDYYVVKMSDILIS